MRLDISIVPSTKRLAESTVVSTPSRAMRTTTVLSAGVVTGLGEAVLDVTPDGLCLVETAPGITVDEVRDATGAPIVNAPARVA